MLALLLYFVGAGAVLWRSDSEPPFYDYHQHGQDWVLGRCSQRGRQSPVDVSKEGMGAPPNGTFTYKYPMISKDVALTNTGHTLSLDLFNVLEAGLTLNDDYFVPLSLNLHSLSEHTFDGKHTPAELHLVHKHPISSRMLIVAIPLNAATPPTVLNAGAPLGPAPAPVPVPAPAAAFLQTRDRYAPPLAADSNFNSVAQCFLKIAPPIAHTREWVPLNAAESLDLESLFVGGTFFHYEGSTTAPPCAEIVTWLVRREPIMLSDVQAQYALAAIFGMNAQSGNNRAVMPLNGRNFNIVKAQHEAQKLSNGALPVTGLPPTAAPTERETRVRTWANDALTIAKNAVEKVKAYDIAAMTDAQAVIKRLDEPPW